MSRISWIRCEICGKFMSKLDLEVGHCDFTPDTAFSYEKVEWYHKKCREESKCST